MASVFSLMLNMSITASIIIVIVLLVRLCIRKLPKIYSYVLWSVVLFRLICPISISLPVSILSPFSESSSQSSAATSTMEYISVQPRLSTAAGEVNVPVSAPQADEIFTEKEAVIESANVPSGERIDTEPETEEASMSAGEIILTICGWIWVVGVFAISSVTVWQHIKLKKHLATAWILRGNVYESENIDTAFVLGVFNPKIYLPSGLPFDVQKAVLLHEQTHQSRGDNIVKVIAYIALAVHWFNPLVWLSYKLACDDMEKSCDEAVLRGMTKRGYDMKSVKYEYGKMLVAMSSGQWRLFSPVSFAENGTKARVMNVAAYRRVAFKSMIAVILACAVVLAAGIINPRSITAKSAAQEVRMITINGVDYQSDAEELDFENIDDLSFLKEFPNLTSLSLYAPQIDDTEAWSYLSDCVNLKELNVRETNTIEFLRYCPDLETLGIGGYVRDLTPLSYIKELKSLHLSDFEDRAPDMSPIAVCSGLQELDTDFAVFEKITEFDSELECLRNLRSLILSYEVSETETQEYIFDKKLDISLLAKLPNLEFLSLSNFALNSFESIKAFDDLDVLKDFSMISIDEMPSLDFMKGMSGLQTVTLLTNEYEFDIPCDISALGTLESLEEVYLGFPSIRCESGALSGLHKLKKFGAGYNEDGNTTLDLSILKDLTGLEELYIGVSGEVNDFSPLSLMTNLKSLEIRGPIHGDSVMSYIGGLTNLESLQISRKGEDISRYEDLDITPLSRFSNLKLVGIDGFRCDLAALSNSQNIEFFYGDSMFSNTELFRSEHPDCEITIYTE